MFPPRTEAATEAYPPAASCERKSLNRTGREVYGALVPFSPSWTRLRSPLDDLSSSLLTLSLRPASCTAWVAAPERNRPAAMKVRTVARTRIRTERSSEQNASHAECHVPAARCLTDPLLPLLSKYASRNPVRFISCRFSLPFAARPR